MPPPDWLHQLETNKGFYGRVGTRVLPKRNHVVPTWRVISGTISKNECASHTPFLSTYPE